MYEWPASRVTVVRVIDGDTIVVALDLGFNISTEKILRLQGIDTPEIKGKEKSAGIKSKVWVENALNNASTISLTTYKSGKFGRFLTTVYYDNVCLNDELIEKGLAKPYGKRSK